MPQIAQLTRDSWYLISQVFWLLLVFGTIYFVIGRGMFAKIVQNVDVRDRKIADDIAAAKAARDEADRVEEDYRTKANAVRAEAQSAVQEAKNAAASTAEQRVRAADQAVADRLAGAEARIAESRATAMQQIDVVASDAARDLVRRLSGLDVTDADAQAAVKAVARG